MNRDDLLNELRRLRDNVRGLAAKAVLNYLVTELEEINASVNEEVLNQLLMNALSLISIEEEDIVRVREAITRIRPGLSSRGFRHGE
ncbi:MAG: hypothetical protein L7G96_08105 [Vulcanisaeta sp.]|nr:hypothetical protein [Vulcanisaeta sp.]